MTHLVELLSHYDPSDTGIKSIKVLCMKQTAERLPVRPWLELLVRGELEMGKVRRFRWLRTNGRTEFRRSGCDIVFAPGGTNFSGFEPYVAMSQNMLPFETRERGRYLGSLNHLRLLMLRFSQGKTLRRANGAIFLTEYARRTTETAIGGCLGEVAVIPHGIGEKFVRIGKERMISAPQNSGKLKLLYVSIVNRYKHQWMVLEAVEALRKRSGMDLELTFAGPGEPFSLKKLDGAMERIDPGRVWARYVGAIPHDELDMLYKQADVGIFASSCENMPIILLEKMSAGLPTICSDRGPMQEVAGDAVIYFDPESVDSIVASLAKVTESADLRVKLGRRALEVSSGFCWEVTSRKTFAFIERIARLGDV